MINFALWFGGDFIDQTERYHRTSVTTSRAETSFRMGTMSRTCETARGDWPSRDRYIYCGKSLYLMWLKQLIPLLLFSCR